MSTGTESFTFEIYTYRPSLNGFTKAIDPIIIPLLILVLICLYLLKHIIPFELSLVLATLVVLISKLNRSIRLFNGIKPVDYTKKITVDQNELHYEDQKIKLSQIRKLSIELRNKHFENVMSENNVIELITFNSSVKLGLVINNTDELTKLNNCVDFLKKKGVRIECKNLIKD